MDKEMSMLQNENQPYLDFSPLHFPKDLQRYSVPIQRNQYINENYHFMKQSMLSSFTSKQNYARKICPFPVEEQSLYNVPTTFTPSDYWPSLSHSSINSHFKRSNTCNDPIDLIRPTDSMALSLSDSIQLPAHQTYKDYSLDHQYNHIEKPVCHCSTLDLSCNIPYQQFYMPVVSSAGYSNHIDRKNLKMDENLERENVELMPTIAPKVNQRKYSSKHVERHLKARIKRIKQKNKLLIFKFIMHKRKQQENVSKKKQLKSKNESTIVQSPDNNTSTLVKIMKNVLSTTASSLKIIFNTDQQIASISLQYYRRRKAFKNTENKLNLLIEAVHFVELYQEN